MGDTLPLFEYREEGEHRVFVFADENSSWIARAAASIKVDRLDRIVQVEVQDLSPGVARRKLGGEIIARTWEDEGLAAEHSMNRYYAAQLANGEMLPEKLDSLLRRVIARLDAALRRQVDRFMRGRDSVYFPVSKYAPLIGGKSPAASAKASDVTQEKRDYNRFGPGDDDYTRRLFIDGI